MLGRIGMRAAHMDPVQVKHSWFTYPGVWTGNFRNAANDIIRVTAHHFGISRRVLRFPRPLTRRVHRQRAWRKTVLPLKSSRFAILSHLSRNKLELVRSVSSQKKKKKKKKKEKKRWAVNIPVNSFQNIYFIRCQNCLPLKKNYFIFFLFSLFCFVCRTG